MSTKFEIRRRHAGDPMSRVVTAAGPVYTASVQANGVGNGLLPRGTAIGYGPDIDTGLLAQGSGFVGFMTRDLTDQGATLTELYIPQNPLALPNQSGTAVGLEKAEEVQCAGVSYILTSGTGAISLGTPQGTKLSFKDGRFYVAQLGDVPYYTLTFADTDTDGSGDLRILVEMII